MTLIDAPKSTLDFSNLVLLIVDGMVKLSGSLNLGRSYVCKITDAFSNTLIISSSFSFVSWCTIA